MKAFIGRFIDPSGFCPGVAYCRIATSGVGLTDGVTNVTLRSEVEGEIARSGADLGPAGLVRRAERLIASLLPYLSLPSLWCVGSPGGRVTRLHSFGLSQNPNPRTLPSVEMCHQRHGRTGALPSRAAGLKGATRLPWQAATEHRTRAGKDSTLER